MRRDQRGVSPVALLLLIFLLISIVGVSTVLVGRALGWWTYAELPVIGRFFPAPPVEEPEEESPSEPVVDPVAELTAELAKKQEEIAALQSSLDQKNEEVTSLSERLAELTAQLEQQTADSVSEKWQETAKMLQNMRAEQAAAIISHYDDAEIMQVLQLMSAETAGGILSKMDPARAARVTAASR